MKRFVALSILLIFAIALCAFAAGTVTTTEIVTGVSLRKITFTWTSSAGGAADGITTAVLTGEILRVVQIPDGGATQPTDLYDVVVTDSDGADVLHGLGANLSNATATNKDSGLGSVTNSKLTLAVTNAGNAKAGKTILYIR
jgi:hypothetical protein